MKLLMAIRDYINRDGGKPLDLQELKAFKDSLSEEERSQYKMEMEGLGYVIED